MAPSLVDCLQSSGSRVFVFLSGSSLHRLSVVLESHAPTRALLFDDALWSHLVFERFQTTVRQGSRPHRAYVEMSCQREWFQERVTVVQGDLQTATGEGPLGAPPMDVLIFPTTPTLLHPHASSAAGAVHKLGQDALTKEIERVRQQNPRNYLPGSAVHTPGGNLSQRFPHLLHCIGPHSMQSQEEKGDVITAVYRNALVSMVAIKLRRAMIIPVGTGIAQCPVQLAADATMQCLWDFTQSYLDHPSRTLGAFDEGLVLPLDDVVVLCRDTNVFDAFSKAKRAILDDLSDSDDDAMSVDEVDEDDEI